MRYTDLITENEDDDAMFGTVTQTGQQTRQRIAAAQFSDNIPVFMNALNKIVVANAGPKAREITHELGKTVRAFRGSEEIAELAYDMITVETPKYLHMITQWIAENPARATDEDELHDYLSNLAEDVRHKSELWVYISEWLEDMYDEGDDNPGQMEEYEFDLAMTVSGELTDLLSKAVQQAFASASRTIAVGESNDDADLFGSNKTTLPAGHEFSIFINNKKAGKDFSIERAVARVEKFLAGATGKYNIQVVDEYDGEIMWSGGTGREGQHYRAGKYNRTNHEI